MLKITIALAVLLLGIAVMFGVRSALAERPKSLGHQGGRLAACPGSPNCVSSQATSESQQVGPFAFSGEPSEALARVKRALEAEPRATVVAARDDYLHVECRSALFRFVDDVEVVVDQTQGVIHIRSASRVGHSDLGVNRARVERVRARLKS